MTPFTLRGLSRDLVKLREGYERPPVECPPLSPL